MPPTLRDQLGAKRTALLKSIQAAATTGNSPSLLGLSDQLRRTEQLLAQHDSWIADAEILLSASPSNGRPPHSPPQAVRDERAPKPSSRTHGTEIRAGFVRRASAAGLQLSPHRGAIYRTARGTKIGIAVATERQPNRWFLGLSQNEFDSAALLCQTKSGRTLDVCLPRAFVQAHRFSRSGGQDKFNVVRREGHLYLTIPGLSPVTVEQYVGAISGLS